MKKDIFLLFLFSTLLTACLAPAAPTERLRQTATLIPIPSQRPAQTSTPASTPTPQAPVNVLQRAVALTLPLSGSLALEKQFSGRMTIDDNDVYWLIYNKPNTIFRASLQGGTAESFIHSRFDKGDLNTLPFIRTGEWFLYVDRDNSGGYMNWEVRAKNVQNEQEKILLSGSGDGSGPASLGISASDEVVAFGGLLPAGSQGNCEESVVGFINLQTNKKVELERDCIREWLWNLPQISGQTLVVEQDFPDEKGGGANLVLFDDVYNPQPTLLAAGNATMPDISFPWLVWKQGPRFEYGKVTIVYNLNTQAQRVFLAPGNSPSDPRVNGKWLYWDDVTSIYLYDLEREQAWQIVFQEISYINSVNIHGNMIAWARQGEFADSGTVLEWAQLP